MHLTDEQLAIGKENFYATIGSDLTRRNFLKDVNARGLTSGSGLGAKFFGYEEIDKLFDNPKKRVRVAVLGTGDEAGVLIGAINPKYVQVVAIADIRPFNIHRAFHGDVSTPAVKLLRTGLIQKYGYKDEAESRSKIRVYTDYKELIAAEKDRQGEDTVEAVIIGLPLWLHAPAAIAAMQNGWHVLTEKLMAHSVANCKEMARAAKQYKKHCATGHQRHYNVLYDHAKYLLANGVLGDLHYIRAQWHRNNRPGADSWKQPLPTAVKGKDGSYTGRLDKVLANFEKKLSDPKLKPGEKKDLEEQIAQAKAQIADQVLVNGGEWSGFKFKSAKDYGYVDATLKIDDSQNPYDRPATEELIRWRLFDRTSAGLMAELGSHQLDAASIFIAAMHGGKKQHPLSVSATATRTVFPESLDSGSIDRDVDDHIHCVFDYAGPGYDPKDELGKQKTITVAYSSINGNGFGGYGETVFGTKGTLYIEREKDAYFYERAEVNLKTNLVKDGKNIKVDKSDAGDPLSAAIGLQATFGDVSRGYCEEIEHWAYCIRKNPEADHGKEMPRCYPEVAMADAVIALTTNISAKRGETVLFDEAWFDCDKDDTPEAKYAGNDELKKHYTPNLGRYS
ncbi:MAG: Gfo/Idh/MocA family oxidoreductase [Planctomycetaceae bacterium]|jgi:predicted dehydrogenase|nr:Gfo/Idh/MocA family oxidoreductase [Planctomycetaceae bacterium]